MTAAGGPPLLPAVGWSVLQAEARKVRPAGRRVLRHDRVRLIHPAVIRLSREIQPFERERQMLADVVRELGVVGPGCFAANEVVQERCAAHCSAGQQGPRSTRASGNRVCRHIPASVSH